MKIFVAGSKSQYDEVMEIVKRIGNESEVNYVTPGDITAEHMVHSVFQKISECNLVIALQNPDGTLEEDVSYKAEFAKWLKKPIVFISKNDNVLSLAHAKNVGEDINKGQDDPKTIKRLMATLQQQRLRSRSSLNPAQVTAQLNRQLAIRTKKMQRMNQPIMVQATQ